MKRPSLRAAIEVEVLTKSARRCALCYGLDNDFTEKKGQIAHLDKKNTNHSLSNLAFLCLTHHDAYDSSSSQSKGYRKSEVVQYRDKLYAAIERNLPREHLLEEEISKIEAKIEAASEIANRYFSLEKSPDLLKQQILARAKAVEEFIRLFNDWFDSRSDKLTNEKEEERLYEWQFNHLLESLAIPSGVYGLDCDGRVSDSWIERVEYLVSVWVLGEATYDECTDILWELDERYDFDLHWILFGIPNSELPSLAYHLLENFVYVYGLRGQSEHRANKTE